MKIIIGPSLLSPSSSSSPLGDNRRELVVIKFLGTLGEISDIEKKSLQ
jgi:hypothetical protein